MATIDRSADVRRTSTARSGTGSEHSYHPDRRAAGAARASTCGPTPRPTSTRSPSRCVRHSLWNANEEHGSIVANLAVSPIAMETRDFQTAIITERRRDPVLRPLPAVPGRVHGHGRQATSSSSAGPMSARATCGSSTIRGSGPPTSPTSNLMCPVFVDGKLFCWVANNVHQNDIGGTVPGSFCTNAQDIYFDPVVIPPVRIVRNGEIDARHRGRSTAASRARRSTSRSTCGPASRATTRPRARIQSMVEQLRRRQRSRAS